MNTETRAKELANECGRPWTEMGGYEREMFMDAAREEIENYDGAPYCQYCGAVKKKYCDCGPIAANN